MNEILLGIGNRWRKDDGLGPEFIKRALEQKIWLGQTAVIPGEMASILEMIAGKRAVILVDAYFASESSVAPIIFDTWKNLKANQIWSSAMSSHGLGVSEALQMAEILGQMPELVFILAIPGYEFDYGEGFSAKALQNLDFALKDFSKFLEKDLDTCTKFIC